VPLAVLFPIINPFVPIVLPKLESGLSVYPCLLEVEPVILKIPTFCVIKLLTSSVVVN